MTPQDYARVQRMLDAGTVFQSAERPGVLVSFLVEQGHWWRAVIKRTQDGTETYLVSYARARRQQVWSRDGGR